VTVRSAGYRPRRPGRPRPPAIALGLAVVLVALLGVAALALRPTAGPGPSPTTAAVAPSPTVAGDPTAPPASRTAAPPPTASPTAPLEPVTIVPVTHFRAAPAGTSPDEVEAVLAGASDRYEALELVESEADAILAALGIGRPADADRLVLAPDAATLGADLAESRERLAFLRADDVTPAVRALAWGGRALFGVDRVGSLSDWPLRAQLPGATTDQTAYDPAAAWTLFAGGDMLFDRGVYKTIKLDGKGVDFPFDGGTAEITSRYCCSSFGWDLPRTRRTGNEGAVRSLIEGADIAIANFENPAPNRFRFHTSGTVFTADPSMIDGLVNAGIDYVSLANNHIGDAGRQGVLETIENLDDRGVRHSGAGENAAAARTPAVLEAGGVQVAILGYDTIARVYNAGEDRIGSARLTQKNCRQDVRQARDDGAEVVIVFPHWGTEYDPTPFDRQRELADACIDAGADMVIGNHAHWAGALEVRDGRPIWYALGNFVFDQTWSEPTMEGITLELTFHGPSLRQIRMRPHIILDKAQPNFLSTGGDGRVVMGQVFDASKGLLDW
jgi:poly-gamma-glutamate synthesis protein (capsule biosynthesis protein)